MSSVFWVYSTTQSRWCEYSKPHCAQLCKRHLISSCTLWPSLLKQWRKFRWKLHYHTIVRSLTSRNNGKKKKWKHHLISSEMLLNLHIKYLSPCLEWEINELLLWCVEFTGSGVMPFISYGDSTLYIWPSRGTKRCFSILYLPYKK